MDKGEWNDPMHDETIFAYHQEYKLDPSCIIEIEAHANDVIHQMPFVEKGLIQVKFKFSVYKYSQFNIHWYIPLALLGFNPEGHYVVKEKELLQINSIDNDPIRYNRLSKPRNLMINSSKPTQDQLNRGIQPYIPAHGDPINAASKMYNEEAKNMVEWTRMELSDNYQDAVIQHFIERTRPDETGEDMRNLYYQIKDVTNNTFKLIEIYEHQEPSKLGIDPTHKHHNQPFPLKRVFDTEDMQMTHLTKEMYPKSVYKPGESRALLEYKTKAGNFEMIVLPLLALCVP